MSKTVNYILNSTNLSPTEKLVGVAIASTNSRFGFCRTSANELSFLTGLSKGAIYKKIKSMEGKRILYDRKRHGNGFQVCINSNYINY